MGAGFPSEEAHVNSCVEHEKGRSIPLGTEMSLRVFLGSKLTSFLSARLRASLRFHSVTGCPVRSVRRFAVVHAKISQKAGPRFPMKQNFAAALTSLWLIFFAALGIRMTYAWEQQRKVAGDVLLLRFRSEERRVGKECRSRW